MVILSIKTNIYMMLHLWLALLGHSDMGIVDNYHSLFTFSSSSWVVLIWLVSLPLQSLRPLTNKTTASGPSCCCGRYRFLTSKATASVCMVVIKKHILIRYYHTFKVISTQFTDYIIEVISRAVRIDSSNFSAIGADRGFYSTLRTITTLFKLYILKRGK